MSLLHKLQQRREYLKYNYWLKFFGTELERLAYHKAMSFFALTKTNDKVMFLCGNQCGKSTSAAYAVKCWATGEYPEWWAGRRFEHPVDIIIASTSSKDTRDIFQKELLGAWSDQGSGMIPKDAIVSFTKKMGVAEAVDTLVVKSKFNGNSTILFKSYDQGREAYNGVKVHVVVLDEEPPQEIFEECAMRIGVKRGIMLLTFTPFSGLTDMIRMFYDAKPDDKMAYVNMGWDDAPHLTPDRKRTMMAGIHPAFYDVRMKGIPSLGAGAIYPIALSEITVDPFHIPRTWKKAYGMDVGWNRTAVAFGAYDEQDNLYIYDEHYVGETSPILHAKAIKERGEWIKGVIDPASRGRSQHDGLKLIDVYNDNGLHLDIADNAVKAGIQAVYIDMCAGKLKIFKNCTNLLSEIQGYQWDDKGNGQVKKVNDHLCDAIRYLVMSGLDVARAEDYNKSIDIRQRGVFGG